MSSKLTTNKQPGEEFYKYVDLYKNYHDSNKAGGREVGYSGRSILRQVEYIRTLLNGCSAKSALDYGCGRGEQYTWRDFPIGGKMIPSLREYFNLQSVSLYDPAVPQHNTRPLARYDAVICTDVLEHVPESQVAWVLRDIIDFSDKCVFLSIACYKAGTILANGENAHTTVKPPRWWKQRILEAASGREVKIHVVFKHKYRLKKLLKLRWMRLWQAPETKTNSGNGTATPARTGDL
jgi:hypothetical protein